MSDEKKKRAVPKRDKAPPAIFFRLAPDELAALDAFRHSQRVPPDRPQVGKQALLEFLEREGFYAPPHKPPPMK